MLRMPAVILALTLSFVVLLSGCSGTKAPTAAEKAAATAEKAAATAQKAAEQLAQQAATRPAVATLVSAAATAAPVAKPAATATKPPAQQPKPTDKPAPTVAAPAEKLSLDRRDSGLDNLSSYRAKWVGEWKGADNGKTLTATWEWFEEYIADGSQHHWGSKMSTSDSPGQPVDVEMWRLGDTMYIAVKDEAGKLECTMISGDPESNSMASGMLAPGRLGGVNDAKYIGVETVNGIKTKHYRYDESAATIAGFGKVSGDIWVAADGGYVVKDQMSWQGAAGLFGSSAAKASGEGKWTFEVLDANKPFTIVLPDACQQAGAVEVPILPDATDKFRMGQITTYKTATKLAAVAEFYKEKMAEAGWDLEGDPEVSDMLAMLAFIREGERAQITLGPVDGKVQVMIALSKE